MSAPIVWLQALGGLCQHHQPHRTGCQFCAFHYPPVSQGKSGPKAEGSYRDDLVGMPHSPFSGFPSRGSLHKPLKSRLQLHGTDEQAKEDPLPLGALPLSAPCPQGPGRAFAQLLSIPLPHIPGREGEREEGRGKEGRDASPKTTPPNPPPTRQAPVNPLFQNSRRWKN